MVSGWIKLHRSIMTKSWYNKSDIVHLLTHILLTASHKEESIFFNGSRIEILSGELITGRKKLSSDTGIKESRITRILSLLEEEEIISQRGTNRYRIISVNNWEKYQQKSEQPTNSQTSQNRTATEQPNEQPEPKVIKASGDIPNSQQKQKRTANEQPEIQKANTIQEVKNFKEEKNKRKEGGELAFLYLEAAQKMKDFLNENSGAYEAILNAAFYRGSKEEFEEELNRFFAYYSDQSYIISDAIENPYKYVGKLQKWISNVKNFKPKTQNNEEKNRITGDFKTKLRNAVEEW